MFLRFPVAIQDSSGHIERKSGGAFRTTNTFRGAFMSGNRFKMADLIASLIVIMFLTGLAAAQFAMSDETALRVKCASNLRQIGQAMLLYANDNRGAYPRTNWATGDDPKPVWGTPYQADPTLDANANVDPFIADNKPETKYRPAPNDVTAAMFLLLRAGDITTQVFTCPSTDATAWDCGGKTNTAQSWTNWNGEKTLAMHLSYSLNNPYFSDQASAAGAIWNSSISAEYAVAGDMNPGTDDLTKLTTQSPPAQMRHGNSFNHNQEGQNILFGDGHVEFDQNPFVGVLRDNIYTFEAPEQPGNNKSESAGIIGAPVSAEDSVLLPTAKSIGSVDDKGNLITLIPIQPVTADQAASLRQKLAGKYTRLLPRLMHLTVTDSTLSGAWGPMTITYSYSVKGTAGDQIQLTLPAPEVPASSARIDFTPTGMTISRCPAFDGQ
jgi:prepilin-type processing-associated H-X9-DG protein